MKSVGLKVLKNKLSEYVRLAQNGETVLVTDRDTVVARLVPPDQAGAAQATDAVLLDLIRRGIMTPAMVVSENPPPSYGSRPWEAVKKDLEEDRSDR